MAPRILTQRIFRFIVIAGVLAILAAVPARADIYKYIDKNGVLHFTNVPTQSGYRLCIHERPSKKLRQRSSRRYDHLIRQAADRYGLSFSLLKALIKVESDFNPRAVSRAGALGLMQIMPENLKDFRIDNPFDPWENIRGGAWYLNKLLDRFEGRLPLALAAYNAGPNLVARDQRIPPIRETQRYVEKVMKYYYVFRD